MAELLTSYDLAGPDPNPMTVDEVDALKAVCRQLPENPIIIQIGAERGVSTLAMLEERPDAFIFSIDVGERPEERRNLFDGGHDARRVVRGLGRSQNIGAFWPSDWFCHLLLIDGDHRYDGVAGDIDVWVENATDENSYVVFHDYIPPEERAPQIIGRVYEAIHDKIGIGVGCEFLRFVSLTDRLLVLKVAE